MPWQPQKLQITSLTIIFTEIVKYVEKAITHSPPDTELNISS